MAGGGTEQQLWAWRDSRAYFVAISTAAVLCWGVTFAGWRPNAQLTALKLRLQELDGQLREAHLELDRAGRVVEQAAARQDTVAEKKRDAQARITIAQAGLRTATQNAAPAGTTNPARGALLQRISDLRNERAGMLGALLPDHPTVQEVDQRLAEAEERLAVEPETIFVPPSDAHSADANLALAKAELQAALDAAAAWEPGFEMAVRQANEAKAAQELASGRVEQLQTQMRAAGQLAAAVVMKVGRRQALELALCLSLAAVAGATIAAMRLTAGEPVLSSERIERLVGLPILGAVKCTLELSGTLLRRWASVWRLAAEGTLCVLLLATLVLALNAPDVLRTAIVNPIQGVSAGMERLL